ncbi:MAG: hypothetical protein M3Q39_06335 [Actinomycetota bacterium]|nr:hypothetical protein [Actinomycetota bacterium]
MTDANVIAVCQHPDGPGEYVPHLSPTCFGNCDCTPRVYVAVDALTNGSGLEAAAATYAKNERLSRHGERAIGGALGSMLAAINAVTGEA